MSLDTDAGFLSDELTFNFNGLESTAAGGAQATEPSFLADLGNAQISTDVADALGPNDTLSYHGMLDILQEAAAGGMTASKFGALETLVSLMNAPGGISTSAYVEAISHSLIDGDPANEYWTGGRPHEKPLGDLSASSTQADVEKLIGKWFLGTDLPSFNHAGEDGAHLAYEVQKGPLFGPDGAPNYHNINQGVDGDCWFLSTLADVALKDPSAIESMITNNGDGTYGVRFFIDGSPEYVTVNNELPTAGASNNNNHSLLEFANGAAGKPIWAELVEKAFAELNAEPGAVHGQGQTDPLNGYHGIDGGYASNALSEITGQSSTSYGASELVADAAKIGAAFDTGEEVMLSVGNLPKGYQGDLHPDHVFEVVGYDANTGEFTIHNPWGSASQSPKEQMTFTMTAQQLSGFSCSLTVAEGSGLDDHAAAHELEASLASHIGAGHGHVGHFLV
jgi:Calpain family cysteine protease